MPPHNPKTEELRAQIEAVNAVEYPSAEIEERIAESLVANGSFNGKISAQEMEVILRNVVYIKFAQQKFAGHNVDLLHNIPTMKVDINDGEATINFIVHIHKPIVAFLKFRYKLLNDPVSIRKKLSLKKGSLMVKEHTRKFDLKAKAALATINVKNLARKELADVAGVILETLPPQLEQRGIVGELSSADLFFEDNNLITCLKGQFKKTKFEE